MSALIDKLERASRGAGQPLGFGAAAKRQPVAPILLLAAVNPNDAAQAQAVAEASLDAAVVDSAPGEPIPPAAAEALANLTLGVRFDCAQPNDPDGADFQVFSSDSTPLDALAGDERALIMEISPALDASLLRALDALPVDAFLVRLQDPDGLTVRQLMLLGRVRRATSRWLIARLSAPPSRAEAELLRDAGIRAVLVSAAGVSARDLQEAKEMLLSLPRESARKKGRDRSAATIPRPATGSAAPPPSPDPDDDDWEDY